MFDSWNSCNLNFIFPLILLNSTLADLNSITLITYFTYWDTKIFQENMFTYVFICREHLGVYTQICYTQTHTFINTRPLIFISPCPAQTEMNSSCIFSFMRKQLERRTAGLYFNASVHGVKSKKRWRACAKTERSHIVRSNLATMSAILSWLRLLLQ